MREWLILLATHAAVGGAGVVFADRVKNWIRGVPADVAALGKAAEAKVIADVRAEVDKVFASAKARLMPMPPAPVANTGAPTATADAGAHPPAAVQVV